MLPTSDRGQVLPFVVVFLFVLLLFCGIVIDLGEAYRVRRSLQASADAAAAAGASQLPDPAAAVATAHAYGSGSAGKNPIKGVDGVDVTAVANCATGPKFCSPANTVQVTESADVPTTFLSLVGIDNLRQTVHAQACSPCGALPLDIMFVVDRSGSMQGQKLQNAKNGMFAFLSSMDPNLNDVGLALFPPVGSSDVCAPARNQDYDSSANPYVAVGLTNAYGTMGPNDQVVLDPSSQLVSTISCIQAGGSTAYANGTEAAMTELLAGGRFGVQKVIVLLSDGAANTGPGYLDPTSSYRTQPCQTAINSASAAKNAGILIYTIAYDMGGAGSQACMRRGGGPESPAIGANFTLQQMASPGNYFAEPDPTSLTGIFLAISADLARGTSRING